MSERLVVLEEKLQQISRLMQSQRLMRYVTTIKDTIEYIQELEESNAHLKELVDTLQTEEDENTRFTIADGDYQDDMRFKDEDLDHLEAELEDTGDFDREEKTDESRTTD